MNKLTTFVLCSLVGLASCDKKDEPLPYKTPFEKENIWRQEAKTLNFPKCDRLPAAIVRKYDKFDKTTRFVSQSLTFGKNDITMVAHGGGDIQRITDVPEYVLLLMLYHRSLFDFRVMIDDEQIHKIEADTDGVIRMPMRLLVDLANAKKIEVRLNDTEYVLTAQQRQIFKDMACVFVP
jgi:hypothetical protein